MWAHVRAELALSAGLFLLVCLPLCKGSWEREGRSCA